ncbi:MAG: restriction endonuclease subunit S, partial [Candidatus Avispirillum sp.]
EENDFVYNPRKSADAPYGPISSYKYAEAGIVSPLYLCFRAKKEINPAFFEWYFRSSAWHRYVYMSGDSGARHDRVSIKDDTFLAMPINLPAAHEQEHIASFLERIDQRIEMQRALVENLKKYKRGLLREVFDKSHLTSECKYECWKEVKLGEICTYRRGSFPQPYGLPEWYDEEHGMPFIQVADVNDNMTINLDTNRHISDMAKNRSVFIPEGTLIVTLQGTIGRVAITTYDAYIDRTLLVIQNISDCVLKEFLMYAIYMKFDVEKQTADGSIIKTITKETLTDFSIYLPSIHEQQRIVNLLRSFDRRLENSVTVLAELHRFRSSLLQQLFI